MNMIELHIIQSFPVTCLNRDDVGAPKTAFFGGAQRARVSSQSWKRAIRQLAKEKQPGFFGGIRSRFIIRELESKYAATDLSPEEAKEMAIATAHAIGKLDNIDKGNVKTLLFFSPDEFSAVTHSALQSNYRAPLDEVMNADEKKKDKVREKLSKALEKSVKGLKDKVKDIADIAIFGRMVADDHSLMIEGAGLFSHAISTHSMANEIDFFSAVDDLNQEGDEGAGHIGDIEYNSACYYRYVGLNLDLLKDDSHLSHFSRDELAQVVKAFLEASIEAVPSARKNSMFGFTRPDYILGLRRKGQPLSLANAFETPVKSSAGFAGPSMEALKKHFEELKRIYNISVETARELPPCSMDEFIKALLEEETA